MRQVLVAYDFSPDAERALALAVSDLAEMGGGGVLLVHVVGHAEPEVYYPWSDLGADGRCDVLGIQRAQLQLRQVAHRYRSPTTKVEPLVVEGCVTERLLELAKHHGADRLFIGSEGRTDPHRLALGSVATQVAQRASTPVVVVKALLSARQAEGRNEGGEEATPGDGVDAAL